MTRSVNDWRVFYVFSRNSSCLLLNSVTLWTPAFTLSSLSNSVFVTFTSSFPFPFLIFQSLASALGCSFGLFFFLFLLWFCEDMKANAWEVFNRNGLTTWTWSFASDLEVEKARQDMHSVEPEGGWMLTSWDTTEGSYTYWDLCCLTFLRYWETLQHLLLPVYFSVRLTLWPLFWLPHYSIIYNSSPWISLDSTLKKYFWISEKKWPGKKG